MILYHATFECYLDSIRRSGLGGEHPKNWIFSPTKTVCLAADPMWALSYVEGSEDGPEDSLIVILEIDCEGLDLAIVERDSGGDDPQYEYEYEGIIPFSRVKRIL